MELLQLRYFAEAAECENFSKVAEAHLLPQSAISHTIARLERELGVKLFDRQGKRVVLNSMGKVFYDRVSSALQSIDDGVKEAKNAIRTIRLKCYSGARLMPPVIADFMRLHPEYNINLRQVYPNSENYDILIAVAGSNEKNTVEYPLFRESIMLAVPSDHRLANREEISVSEIACENIITVGEAENSTFVRNVASPCKKHGVPIEHHIDTQDLYTAESYVEEGFGVMFYPEMTWGKRSSAKMRFVRISDDGFYRDISAFIKKDKSSDESILRVKDHLISSFARVNA